MAVPLVASRLWILDGPVSVCLHGRFEKAQLLDGAKVCSLQSVPINLLLPKDITNQYILYATIWYEYYIDLHIYIINIYICMYIYIYICIFICILHYHLTGVFPFPPSQAALAPSPHRSRARPVVRLVHAGHGAATPAGWIFQTLQGSSRS